MNTESKKLKMEVQQIRDLNMELKEDLTEVRQAYLQVKEERDGLRWRVAEYKVQLRSFDQIV